MTRFDTRFVSVHTKIWRKKIYLEFHQVKENQRQKSFDDSLVRVKEFFMSSKILSNKRLLEQY
jgi:hypothetical protein